MGKRAAEMASFARSRTVDDDDDKVNGNSEGLSFGQSLLANMCDLYPPGYKRPDMKDALMKAGLEEEEAKKVKEARYAKASNMKSRKGLPDNVTVDDAMYTYDFGFERFEKNPYRIVNKSIAGRSISSLQNIKDLVFLVLTGLRKLPRIEGKTLYRGVRADVNTDEDHYSEGSTVTWPAFSSTSPSMKSTKAFLASGSGSGKAASTLFIIENG